MEMMPIEKCPQCGTEFVPIEIFTDPPHYISRCPKCGFDKVVEPVKDGDEQDEKPPLGCKPAKMVAWSRIADLVDAIRRHCESTNGNEKLVKRWANEITWHCSIIESMKEEE